MSLNSPSTSHRLRVLINAHDFSPTQGSECGAAWNIATRVTLYHDVTVICASGSQVRPDAYKEAWEEYLKEHSAIPGLQVVFVDQPRLARRISALNRWLSGMSDGVGSRPLFYCALRAWHRCAAQRVRELGLADVDVIHHLNPTAYWGAGLLWKMHKPYCWGPLAGMVTMPLRFARWLGWRHVAFEVFRKVSLGAASLMMRGPLRKAAVVWVVTEAEAKLVRRVSGRRVRLMTDTASSPGASVRIRQFDGSRTLLVCWSGLHIHRKALPILLHAVASSLQAHRMHVTVLGGGVETKEWRRLAERLGIKTRISWVGTVPRAEALAHMAKADIFVHTSLRESTPHVVLEALAMGLPVVCHDTCGMAVAVDSRCGIKVPFIGPAESVQSFREILEMFLGSPELLAELSAGALERAGELTWDSKAAEIAATYGECVTTTY